MSDSGTSAALRSLLTSSRTHLVFVFLLTFCLRVVFWTVPGLADKMPDPYVRFIHYLDTAENVREGRGLVFDYAKTHAYELEWKASKARLPRQAYASFPDSDTPDIRQFYDEKGYLLLTLALAELTGEVRMSNALALQSVLSAICAVLLYLATLSLLRSESLALIAAATYALNPLEIMFSTGPDHPIWPVYASVVALFVLSRDWVAVPLATRVTSLLLAGSFLQFCIVQRATVVGVVGVMLIGCLWNLRRIGRRGLAALVLGIVITQVGLASISLEGATVGRPLIYHTLLAGLSEFGDIEGLSVDDAVILRYIKERYDVGFGTLEFNDAFKIELERVLSERPWLPLTTVAKRLGYFLVGYRVGKNSAVMVVAFGLFKIAALIGAALWWRRAKELDELPVMLSCLGVILAPIALHILIVPPLFVYTAPALVLSTAVAACGGLVCLKEVVSRARLLQGERVPLQ